MDKEQRSETWKRGREPRNKEVRHGIEYREATRIAFVDLWMGGNEGKGVV
jgi:hypothetical protein